MYPFYSVDANVPAIIGIDVLTVGKVVVDVMNKCVYSHHHARLENRPPTSFHEPMFLVDNVTDFMQSVRPSQSASADAAYVTADVTGTSSGVGAPRSSTLSDVPSRLAAPSGRPFSSDVPSRPTIPCDRFPFLRQPLRPVFLYLRLTASLCQPTHFQLTLTSPVW